MIDYEKFLNDNADKKSYGTYAIVKYDGREEATYFQHVWDDKYGLWFMPSPCMLYEIENFQCMPYLPDEVDDIRIVSERKCLEWLVNHNSLKIK